MSIDRVDVIEAGPIKVLANPGSDVKDYQIQRTTFKPDGTTGEMHAYNAEQLTQGIEFKVKPQHIYELELLITPFRIHATVLVHIEQNGKTLWKKECIWFSYGSNGKWKFTAK